MLARTRANLVVLAAGMVVGGVALGGVTYVAAQSNPGSVLLCVRRDDQTLRLPYGSGKCPAGTQEFILGSLGPSGPSGPTGATGASGVAGTAGPSGATGASGVAGAAGPNGATGLTGASGLTGGTGLAGATGATGPAPATVAPLVTTYDVPRTYAYTVPTGAKAVQLECVGGGGGGGGANLAASSGGGGGGYAIRYIATPEASYAVVVATGGSGGAPKAIRTATARSAVSVATCLHVAAVSVETPDSRVTPSLGGLEDPRSSAPPRAYLAAMGLPGIRSTARSRFRGTAATASSAAAGSGKTARSRAEGTVPEAPVPTRARVAPGPAASYASPCTSNQQPSLSSR